MKLPKRFKDLFSDSMWSIAGLMLLNISAQFIVYPFLRNLLGSEGYGNALTLISYINIVSVAIGSGCNYARMRQSSEGTTCNGEYNFSLILVSALSLPMAYIAQWLSGINMGTIDTLLYTLLMCAMLWRYYADVDFRLRLDYKGMFLYYALTAAGYLLGIALSYLTGFWPLSLLIGEATGLIYVALKGGVLRSKPFAYSSNRKAVYGVILTLVSTNLLLNLIFNADRLLLNALLDGTAVTLFYVSSLLGKTISLVSTPLNGVIIGHTARYNGKLTMKMLAVVVGLIAALILLGGAACTLASHILIRLLYPQEYDAARVYFWAANLSQVIYCLNNVLTTFLLCFTKSRYQLYINIVYAVAFLAVCIPTTFCYGFDGFVWGLVIVNLIRFGTTCLVGLRQVLINKKSEENAA